MNNAVKAYKKRWTPKVSKLPPKAEASLVRAEIQRVLNRRVEVKKYIAQEYQRDILSARAGVTIPTTIALLPYVALGTSEGTRVGDAVTPKYGKLRMLFNLNVSAAAAVSIPVGVRWWIVRARQQSLTPLSLTVNTFDTFFDALGTQAGFSANSLDMVSQVNTNMWQVCQEGVVMLGVPVAGLSYTTSASSAFSTDRPNQLVEVDYTKALRKSKLTYQQGFTNPVNDNLLLVFTAQYLTDGQSATIGNSLAAVTYCVDCGFTDS